MKFSDAFLVGTGLVGFTLGPLSWLAIHFGGTYVAFVGYEDEAGSILGGLLWLFIWGPLLSGLAMIPVGVAAVIVGVALAPMVMIAARLIQFTSRIRLAH